MIVSCNQQCGKIMPATIKSIAAEAGISYQAVSAVLNGKNNCRVSPQRREQILQIAREQGYQTNFGYKLMRGQTTHTVAIISAMRQIESDSHVRKLVLKLMQKLNLLGYSTYFNNTMTAQKDENIRQIRELINRGTEHFIFIGSPVGHEDIQQEVNANRRTYIGWNSFFDRDLHSGSLEASVKLFKFMMEISGELPVLLMPNLRSTLNDRLNAIKIAGKDVFDSDTHILELPPPQWDETDFNRKAFESGYRGTAELFNRAKKPRSIAYYTDAYALGGALWCHEHNITVGKDVYLSGFNNIDAVRFHPLPIASAAHPVDECIDILLQEMSSMEKFHKTLELELFLRPYNSDISKP